MTSEVIVTCNRCNMRIQDDTPWLRLKVLHSEDMILSLPEGQDTLDLCHRCEADIRDWLASKSVEQIMEKLK